MFIICSDCLLLIFTFVHVQVFILFTVPQYHVTRSLVYDTEIFIRFTFAVFCLCLCDIMYNVRKNLKFIVERGKVEEGEGAAGGSEFVA